MWRITREAYSLIMNIIIGKNTQFGELTTALLCNAVVVKPCLR